MAIVYFVWYQAIGDEASGTAKFAIPLIPVVVFAGSILAHEIGHAVVMEANKIRVGKIALEAWGGYTKPKDDNFSLLQVPAAKYFSVFFAGPCVNLLVAIGLWLFALESPNLQELATQSNTIIDYSLVFAFKINLLMGVFNLLPLFPLDGGHVLRSVLMGISGGSVVPGLVSGLFSLIIGSAYVRYIATTFLESGWEALRSHMLLALYSSVVVVFSLVITLTAFHERPPATGSSPHLIRRLATVAMIALPVAALYFLHIQDHWTRLPLPSEFASLVAIR